MAKAGVRKAGSLPNPPRCQEQQGWLLHEERGAGAERGNDTGRGGGLTNEDAVPHILVRLVGQTP